MDIAQILQNGFCRLAAVVIVSLALVGAFASSAQAQGPTPPCGDEVIPAFEPKEEGVPTIELKRRGRVFSVKPIEFEVSNCRLAGVWDLEVLGASLSQEEFSARLIAKTADTALVVFDHVDPGAFPPGTAEFTLALNEDNISFSTPLVVTRQYPRWQLVALTCVAASIIGFLILALRSAWAGGSPRRFFDYVRTFSNYAVLVTAVPAVWGVYKAQYDQATAWEGLGNEFVILAASACGAFIAAGTATTAATGVGAKTQ
ncbi:MAG: hypothetical protein M3280_05130 [Actinomycetota bacterium]|nr:hypothetical protein [Actinomycetota bacterium]